MKPVTLSKEELVSTLRGIANSVEEGDSFEGSFQYSASENMSFDVMASWRVGNSEGQGGCILLGKND